MPPAGGIFEENRPGGTPYTQSFWPEARKFTEMHDYSTTSITIITNIIIHL
jgi:hypothetical protein